MLNLTPDDYRCQDFLVLPNKLVQAAHCYCFDRFVALSWIVRISYSGTANTIGWVVGRVLQLGDSNCAALRNIAIGEERFLAFLGSTTFATTVRLVGGASRGETYATLIRIGDVLVDCFGENDQESVDVCIIAFLARAQIYRVTMRLSSGYLCVRV